MQGKAKSGSPPPQMLAIHLLVDRALSRIDGSMRFLTGPTVLVAEVPNSEFVSLVAHDIVSRIGALAVDGDALERGLSANTPPSRKLVIFSRDGSSRTHTRERGNAIVATSLSFGIPVIGIAPNPNRHLPRALLEAADYWLQIPQLDSGILTKVVARIVRRRVRRRFLTDDACRTLSLEGLCLAIRPGSTADDCLVRLRRLAAARAKRPVSGPSLNDLHGIGEARAWGEALRDDIGSYRKGEIEWSAVDRGALLAGPPGTGKTTFARALAMACEVPLISGTLATWQAAGTLDLLLRAMRKDFDDAKAAAPAILFIDELDSFGNRATFDHRYRDYSIQVVNALLEELDGVEGRDGVVVLGACNHPGLIDPAILRAGRLDRIFHLVLPSIEELIGILRYYLRDDLSDQDLTPAAFAAQGHSGADVERWIREARRMARKASRPLTFADVLAAISRRVTQMSPEARKVVAYHEAGHCLVARHYGAVIRGVSTIAAGTSGGITLSHAVWGGAPPTRSRLKQRLRVILGGRAAEEIAFGEPSTGSGGNSDSDLATATALAVAMETAFGIGREAILTWHGPPEIAAVPLLLARDSELAARVSQELGEAYGDAKSVLRKKRFALDGLARALLAKSYLDGSEVARIFRRGRAAKRTGRASNPASI